MRTSTLLLMMGVTVNFVCAQDPDAWDFVPGEKLLLYDDYSDMPRGAAPPHWKVRGAAMRLVDGRLVAKPEDSTLTPNVVQWPKNFTLEMEFHPGVFDNDGVPPRTLTWSFLTAGDDWTLTTSMQWGAGGECSLTVEIADPGENQRQKCRVAMGKPNQLAIWSQDGRFRVYLNRERLLDMNQVKFKLDKAALWIGPGEQPVALGPVRIAQSAPDFSQTLISTGRYVSHGILFDVNSDQIKADSKAVLQQIADALRAQAAMKIRIEGHTDNTGDPAKNLELSKRRAASVKAALTALGVAADRLTTDGFGDTKPAAKNDTPQGRAENRRVEFVKI